MKKVTKQKVNQGLNALVWREEDLYVAKAVEIEVASQGKTRKEAVSNLKEAIELYFEDEKVPQSKILPFELLKLEKLFPKIRYA